MRDSLHITSYTTSFTDEENNTFLTLMQ